MAGVPNSMKIMFLLVGLLVAVVTLGLLTNLVVMPMWNKRWVSAAGPRCSVLQGVQASKIGVVVMCNGYVRDTAEQVEAIIKRAACPHRVVVAVVHFGPVQKEPHTPQTVQQTLLQGHAFRGITDDFNIAEHVVVLQGGAALLGAPAALLAALPHLRQLAVGFVTFLAPATDPVSNWDAIALEEHEAARAHLPQGQLPLLSYAVTSTRMAHPTFPVLSFVQRKLPVVAWQPFAEAPTRPHAALALSTDFIFARLDAIPADTEATLRSMACPPGIADLLLSCVLQSSGNVAIMHPTALIVNGRASNNHSRYFAQLQQDPLAKRLNMDTTQRVYEALGDARISSMLARVGVDVTNRTVSQMAAMGMLGDAMADEDVRVKYGTRAAFNSVWESIRDNIPTHAQGHRLRA